MENWIALTIIYALACFAILCFVVGWVSVGAESSDLADFERQIAEGDRRLADVLKPSLHEMEHSRGV